MATKEDILEQIVEEYLVHKGYFVRNNIKFLPRKDHPDFVLNKDSNHSDIDVLAIHPKLSGPDAVMAVSCKSWQSGFNPTSEIDAIVNDKTVRGREAWQSFRELCVPKWSEAFVKAVQDATGTEKFTYCLAVAHVKGDRQVWQSNQPFIDADGSEVPRCVGKQPLRYAGDAMMALTKDFKDTIQARAQRDTAFRKALLQEGVECLLAGDVDTGKAVLRDYINATIGFEELSQVFDKSSKSLMRMFVPKGNPQANNLFAVIQYLQEQEGIHLEVKARKVA